MAILLSNVVNVYSNTTYSPKTEVVDASKTLVANGPIYLVNVSAGAVTLTLPAIVNNNDKIVMYDVTGDFITNSPTIARNGHKIMGVEEDLLLDVENTKIEMIYTNPTLGWRLFIS